MKFAIATALALVIAAPAAAQTTVIDFGSLALGTSTSATFGDYRIANMPGYGSGTSVFETANGQRALGDIVLDGNGAGYIISRLDGRAFNVDSVTYGAAQGANGRVIVATYSGRDVARAVSSDGVTAALGLTDFGDVFIDANSFSGTPGIGISGLTLSLFGSSGAVPEPACWALMIGGFGMVGGSLRRAAKVRSAVSFA